MISKATEGRRSAAASTSAASPAARGSRVAGMICAGILPVLRVVDVDGVPADIRVVTVVLTGAVIAAIVVVVGVVSTAVVTVVVIIVVRVVVMSAVRATMPGAVTVIGSAVVIHSATMPVAVPTAVSPAAAASAHHCPNRHSSSK